MKKSSVIVVVILVTGLLFGVAMFGVLSMEEKNRKEQYANDHKELLARLEEVQASRKAYFDSVQKQKAEFQKQMEEAQKQYEDLLARKDELIANEEKVVTKTVEQVVPVTTKQTVTVTKPKSTKSTKTS